MSGGDGGRPVATSATFATRTGEEPKGGRWPCPQTDWGLPQWKHPERYGPHEEWDKSRWRWEFLRRRADYRADFEAALSGQHDPLALPTDMTAEDAAWLIGDGLRAWPFAHSGAQRYGLDEFFDPVISDWMSLGPEWTSGIVFGGFHRTEWVVTSDGGSEEVPAEHMVAITFDLRRPLNEQLREAHTVLKQAQFDFLAYGEGAPEGVSIEEAERRAFRGVPSPRKHLAKWLLYLRVLDAREAGASWAEMTAHFFTEGLLARRKAPEGGYCAPPPQAARDVWEQARKLALRF